MPDFDYDQVTAGLKRMAWGVFKKIVVAERQAVLVDFVYNDPTPHKGLPLLLATVLFAFQIYADFSGYSDIAIGMGQLLGLRLAPNFERPYFAESIAEFWRRWHISFSSWLRDYLFLPLTYAVTRRLDGRSPLGLKEEEWGYSLAAIITMLLGGLWHGAGSDAF